MEHMEVNDILPKVFPATIELLKVAIP
jgi:Na+-driven multidrug efflux pump